MTDEEREQLDGVARSVADLYAARSTWACRENLRQAAWLAIMEARPHWAPDKGMPLAAYCHRACVRQLRRVLWQDSVPVDIPVGRSAADTRRAAGHVRGVEIPEQTFMGVNVTPSGERLRRDVPEPFVSPAPDAGLMSELLRRQMREAIENAVVRTVEDVYALRVLLDEMDSEEAALELGVALREINRAVKRARRRLSTSPGAWAIAREVML